VQAKEGIVVDEEEVLEYCRSFLPYSKRPKVVIVGNDVPVTSTGKYQRSKFKHLFARWKPVQFSEGRHAAKD
jgi:long-chain acyl-CoA synthetase